MSKPIIAVDFDDVIFPTSTVTIDFYNKTYGTTLTMDHAYTYANPDVWLADNKTVLERVNGFASTPETMRIPPMAGAIETITNLAKTYSFILITGRAASIKGFTKEWLTRYFGDIFTDHIFIEELQWDDPNASKLAVCNELGARYLIDDTPLHLSGFAGNGINGILFGDYPWNDMTHVSPDFFWCKDWSAVKGYFDERAN